jgi:hypothetical protein
MMQSRRDQEVAATYIASVLTATAGGVAISTIRIANPGVCTVLLLSCNPTVTADGTVKLLGNPTYRAVADLIRRQEIKELIRILNSEKGKVVILE